MHRRYNIFRVMRYATACVNACVHRQRARAPARKSGGVCAPGAKVKYAAAPASRSIMRRVTHASLLHCEPCYASARQGARRIYGGISAVIERYAPSSRYLFLPVAAGAPRRLSARLLSPSAPLVPPLLHITGASSCQSCGNWLRRVPKILRGTQARERAHKSIRYL